MAYKFQIGAATLSGSVTFKEAGVFSSGLSAEDASITNVGDIDADSISVADAANGLNIDFSAANTGQSAISLRDNMASALEIKEGSNLYMKFVSTNTGEQIEFSQKLKIASGVELDVEDGSLVQGLASANILVGNASSVAAAVAMSGDIGISNAGLTSIQAGRISGSMLNASVAGTSLEFNSNAIRLAASSAGNGLTGGGASALSVDNDGSTITVGAGGIKVSDNGIAAGQLADDAVGADQLAANAVVNASVATGAAIAANKIDFNVDLGGNISFGNQSDDDVTFGGGVVVAGDLTVQGSTTTVDSTTINISSSFTFEGPADDHETILTCGTPTQDNTLTLPQFSGSAEGVYHIPVLADATTAASALVTAAEFALLDGGSTVGTNALADADGFMHNDDGTMKQTQVIKIAELAFSKVSGDALIASGGALTIQANAVEGSMLNNNIVSGLTDIGAAIADTDEMIVSDNGTIRRTDMSRLKTFIGNGTTALNGIGDADATLAVGLNYASANMSTGRTWTLPASPSLGESVRIKAAGVQSGAITIARAGSQTIDGNLTSIILESDNAAVELVYVASDDWRVF